MYKEKDLPIIALLRKNSRISLTDIGTKTNTPISTVYDRLKYHDGRAVKKYTILVDFNLFGFTTRAHMLISVPKEKRAEAMEFLSKHHCVNSLYKINNNYDFLVDAVFKHIKYLEDFIDAVEQRFQADKIEVHHIIDDVKRECFMEDPRIAKMLIDDEE